MDFDQIRRSSGLNLEKIGFPPFSALGFFAKPDGHLSHFEMPVNSYNIGISTLSFARFYFRRNRLIQVFLGFESAGYFHEGCEKINGNREQGG